MLSHRANNNNARIGKITWLSLPDSANAAVGNK